MNLSTKLVSVLVSLEYTFIAAIAFVPGRSVLAVVVGMNLTHPVSEIMESGCNTLRFWVSVVVVYAELFNGDPPGLDQPVISSIEK